LSDPDWVDYLEQHGVVVLKSILTNYEAVKAREMYKDWVD